MLEKLSRGTAASYDYTNSVDVVSAMGDDLGPWSLRGPAPYRIPVGTSAGFGISGPSADEVSAAYKLRRVHSSAVNLRFWQQEYKALRDSADTSYQVGDQLGGLEYFSLAGPVELPVSDWQIGASYEDGALWLPRLTRTRSKGHYWYPLTERLQTFGRMAPHVAAAAQSGVANSMALGAAVNGFALAAGESLQHNYDDYELSVANIDPETSVAFTPPANFLPPAVFGNVNGEKFQQLRCAELARTSP